MRSRLYRGTLSHHRGGAVKNNFSYRLYTMSLDLDELDALDERLRLFSVDRGNVFCLRGRDYALAAAMTQPSQRLWSGRPLKERALELLSTAELRSAPVSVVLVTQLRVLDYVFNPVSFFLAYDAADELVAVIAEINNTHDQTFSYVLDERNRINAPGSDDAVFETAKAFFVSPFIGDACDYQWLLPTKRDATRLDIRMRLSRDVTGRFFAARLRGEARPLSDRSLLLALLRFPALPAQIWSRIHLQALRLRALGLQYRRPIS